MLQFNNFQKFYGSFQALKIDELQLDQGVYWIKGINGSGKSTLLKTIAGMLSFKGDIVLNRNINIKNHPTAYRKLVNFGDAEPLFPEFLTGKEMISLFSRAKTAPLKQEQFYIESMELESFIQRPLGTYSSGMLKKLSLVLAFIGEPQLILLDEPLITLDAQSLGILNSWISEKHKNYGTSFLLSSHQNLNFKELVAIQEMMVDSKTLKICQ